MIVDGKTLLISTGDFSPTSLDHSRELGVIVTDTSTLKAVQALFSRDVAGIPAQPTPIPSPTVALPTPAPIATDTPLPTSTPPATDTPVAITPVVTETPQLLAPGPTATPLFADVTPTKIVLPILP